MLLLKKIFSFFFLNKGRLIKIIYIKFNYFIFQYI